MATEVTEPRYSMLLYFKKNPAITTEEFIDYYEKIHAPRLVGVTKQAPGFIAYTRHYVNHEESRLESGNPFLKFGATVPEIPFDVVNTITFETRADALEFSRVMYDIEENAVEILKDEHHMFSMDQSRGVVVNKSVSIG